MKPILSIVIPVYNTAATLDRCIESVIHQAEGCELILVNDGSPDGAGQICDLWAQRYQQIRVVHQQNGGLSAARNAGINVAVAPYITFIDSDDTLAPHTLPQLLNVIADHPEYDIIEYPIELHAASPQSSFLVMADRVYTQWRSYWLDTRAYTHTYACNKIFCRRLFSYALFPVGKTFEDVWLLPQLLPHCQYIATVSTGCYCYYDNQQGITHRATGTDLINLLMAHCQVLPRVSNAHYYTSVVNIALDVYQATGQVPELPELPYWHTPKLLVKKLLGFRLLCLLHQLLKPRR